MKEAANLISFSLEHHKDYFLGTFKLYLLKHGQQGSCREKNHTDLDEVVISKKAKKQASHIFAKLTESI